MTAPVFTEVVHPMAPIIEALHALSMEEVIVAQNQTIVVGQVMGAIGVSGEELSTVSYASGNTGNGTLGTIVINPQALNGVYSGVFLTAGPTAEFELINPNGQLTGTGKVGTAFSADIGFTITTGATNFAVGDVFTVNVVRPFGEAGEQYEAWNPAATDGSQYASAIAAYPAITGAGQTMKIAALRRDGAARLSDLTWNASATSAQIAQAQQQLAAKNIVLR